MLYSIIAPFPYFPTPRIFVYSRDGAQALTAEYPFLALRGAVVTTMAPHFRERRRPRLYCYRDGGTQAERRLGKCSFWATRSSRAKLKRRPTKICLPNYHAVRGVLINLPRRNAHRTRSQRRELRGAGFCVLPTTPKRFSKREAAFFFGSRKLQEASVSCRKLPK